MKSGATETSYYHLFKYLTVPDYICISHIPNDIKQSTAKIKILWSHNSYDQPCYLNFDHHICDIIVCPSHWLKLQFIKFHKIPDEKLVVIPNGVAEEFVYSTKKTKTLIHTSIPYKGLELLPKIFPKVKQAHPDCVLKIFSSMNLYGDQIPDPYTDLYKELESIPGIDYSPAIDRENLVKHLQSAAIFVHPNIWEETSCVSLIEAQACGCYPVLSDIGALAETSGELATLVQMEGVSTNKGWQVTDQFINIFAQSVISALDHFSFNRTYYDEISKQCSDHALKNHNWKNIAEQWKILLRKLDEKIGS